MPSKRTPSTAASSRASTKRDSTAVSSSSAAQPKKSRASPPDVRLVAANVKVGEVQSCAICERSSKETPWAAEHIVQKDGHDLKVPVGTACVNCYRIGVEVLKYDTWALFTAEYERSPEIQARVLQIGKNLAKPGSAVDFDTQSVEKVTSFDVEFQETFVGLTEAVLKSNLEVLRLTKSGLKGVPEIFHSCRDSEEMTKVYLFARSSAAASDPDALTVIFRTRTEFQKVVTYMTAEGNLWEGHASSVLMEKSVGMSSSFDVEKAGGVVPFETFLQAYNDTLRRPKSSSILGGVVAPTDALTGPAAAEFIVQGTPAEEDMLVDLTMLTPTKAQAAPQWPRKSPQPSDLGSACEEDGDCSQEENDSGDWLSYYKRKLPLRDVLTGNLKGRSAKALRERRDRLKSQPSTRSAGLLLEHYYTKVNMALSLRNPEKFKALTDEELDQIVATLVGDGVVFPADVAQQLLCRHAHKLSSERRWEEYFDTMLPFEREGQPPGFDAQKPTLRSLPRVQDFKSGVFVVSVMDEILCANLIEAEKKTDVLAFVQAGSRALECSVDLVDLDVSSAAFAEDIKIIFEAVEVLLTMPFEVKPCVDALLAKKARGGQTGPIHRVAMVIRDSLFYSGLVEKYKCSLPLAAEKGSSVSTYKLCLAEFLTADKSKEPFQPDDTAQLKCMTTDYLEISRVTDSQAALGLDILKAIVSHCDKLLESDAANHMPKVLGDVRQLLSEASVAFPLEVKLPQLQQDLSNRLVAADVCNLESKLVEAIQVTFVDALLRLPETQEAAEACSGTTIKHNTEELVKKMLNPMLQHVSATECDTDTADRLLQLGGRLASMLSKSWACAVERLRVARRVVGHEKFVCSTNSEDDALSAFRKDLAELLGLKKTKALIKGDLGNDMITSINDYTDSVIEKFTSIDQKLLDDRMVVTSKRVEDYQKALLDLEGGQGGNVWTWAAKVQKDASIEQLVAQTAHLLEVNEKELTAALTALATALSRCEEAFSLSGHVEAPPRKEAVVRDLLRGYTLRAEVGILKTKASGKGDVRSVIQSEIKAVRVAGGKERDLLHQSLYKFAFPVLTNR